MIMHIISLVCTRISITYIESVTVQIWNEYTYGMRSSLKVTPQGRDLRSCLQLTPQHNWVWSQYAKNEICGINIIAANIDIFDYSDEGLYIIYKKP
jgi:hypothetical protein